MKKKRNRVDEELGQFVRFGREAFEAGRSRQPFKCERAMKIWASEPCEIGSATAKKHQKQAEFWLAGWDIANLTSHLN